jgi:type IV fimbrial biogenesis protein FimT
MMIPMNRRCQGFTLIEMIITMSIISILTAYGIPNYRAFKLNQTMTQEINRLSSTIRFARSQSIINGEHVILCATQSFTACDGISQWHGGWMVFADSNRNRLYDSNDRMLLHENKMNSDLQAVASIHRQKIRFDVTGFATGTNLTIRFCDNRGAEHGKAVVISNVGRPRVVQNINTCG